MRLYKFADVYYIENDEQRDLVLISVKKGHFYLPYRDPQGIITEEKYKFEFSTDWDSIEIRVAEVRRPYLIRIVGNKFDRFINVNKELGFDLTEAGMLKEEV